ncbi:MAG: hypothetical protein GWO02_07785, partial [Gammaproteobacteria bacterium]|nr:hypothetical protein [Gammaproteobacteria bacterium]
GDADGPSPVTRPADGNAPGRSGGDDRPDASTLLAAAAEELRLRGYSPRTRKAYLQHIRRFLRSAPRSAAGTDPTGAAQHLEPGAI